MSSLQGFVNHSLTRLNNTESWNLIENFAFNLETVYLWIILVIGFPGNCATIVTVVKMCPARSLTVYITILAVVDNLAIVDKLLMFVLLDHGVHVGQFGCKILGYFGNLLSTFANWLLVAMSVERFVAVWFPFKLGQSWTFKKSIMAVLVLALPLIALFLHLFWIMRFVDDKEQGMVYCAIHEEYKYFMMHVWYWINVLMYAAIPCTLLILFNLLIIMGIVRSRKVQKRLSGNKDDSSSIDRLRQVTIMLVAAAISLVILTTPRCVMLILTPYWNPPEQTMEGSVEYLLDTIAFVLCDFNHAINFYVYSMSAKRFRRQFLDLFQRRKHQMTPTKTQYISLSTRQSVRLNGDSPSKKMQNG
ncbi:FMRFamide receptor-like [Haliotis rufescens]|uniref:FMRFamide receptor-like n=1 Tax=Haliotis rufescens TaxID=6454 RepID=UPI00201E9EB6|nr:FMRFamide receptor-like [Haliotis rufescens]